MTTIQLYGRMAPPSGNFYKHIHSPRNVHTVYSQLLEDTARYAGLLLASAEGFGGGLFLPFGQKKNLVYCFGQLEAIFCVQ